jgi:vacuolar-type H+-ATPase subunit C/Vma6
LETPRDQAVGLWDAELWLDEEHFLRLGACAGRAQGRDDASIIRAYVALLVDLANLRTSLRFLGRHLPREEVRSLYLGGGSLNEEIFSAMLAADGLEQIYHQLPRGPLTAVLDRGMLSFASAGRASIFERPGDEQVLRLVHRLARRWPVSVAAPLDYLAKARNEWINLKMIACGVRYGLPVGKVRESLVYV